MKTVPYRFYWALFATLFAANAWAQSEALFDAGMSAYERHRYAAAVSAFEPLTHQGHAGAEFMLGVAYYYGRGVSQDRRKAAVWFYKSARQGNPGAQLAYGSLHIRGVGVIQNLVKAHTWLAVAALSGVPQLREQALRLRDDAAGHMTASEIERARELTREWRPVRPGYVTRPQS